MNPQRPRIVLPVAALLSLLFSLPPHARAQSADSLAPHPASGGALQFQLIGGLGANYLYECSAGSSLRVGADASYSHTTASGTNASSSSQTTTEPATSTGKPDQTSTSYQISISGLYIHTLGEFAHTSLYCGAGPMGSYSHNNSTNKSNSASNYTFGVFTTNSVDESRLALWGVGPLAIVGAKSRLIDHVSLSAEVSLSALYQWTSTSSSSHVETRFPTPQDLSVAQSTNSSDLTGWTISLSSIRIGVIVGL